MDNLAITLIVSIPVVVYMVIFFLKILPHPLMGTDVVQYGIVGNMLFEAKSLLPIWSKDFAESGFVYKITCAPSFSLLLTWEHLLDSIFALKSDLYFRSLSAYYGFLILGVQFYWVAKRNKWLALLAAVALMSGYGFFLVFLKKHIDSYRIFFVCLSWIMLAYSLRDKNVTAYLLLGAFSGLAAYAHRIGIIVAGINCLVFFMIMQGGFRTRLLRVSCVFVFILACGGDHYIFDLIWGTGDWLSR